ncbi:MAG: glycosyltransferase family 61 protein [Rhodospirillaceae bacterium]|nr:glycosyltransferase family 61 protein [Rhodospirillaceae bacterium]
MDEAASHEYMADLDIIRFCQENGFPVRSHPFFRDVEKYWPFVLCELEDASVVGPYPTPVCQKQPFYDSLSNFGPSQRRRMDEHLKDNKKAVPVDKAVLVPGNLSFGHFVDVHLLQTLYLQLFEELADLPVITMAGMPRGCYDLFAMMGCPEQRLIRIGEDEAVICNELYVPTAVGGVAPGYTTYSVPAKLCRMFRDLMTAAFLGQTESRVEPFRKVYIQRINVANKGVLNALEVDEFMSDCGFELIDPGKLSLSEQVQIAHETKYFVTAVGSQMHLADFAQAGAKLLMLSTVATTARATWDAMDRFPPLGIDHHVAVFECDEHEAIMIDLDQLHYFLGDLDFIG